MLGNHGNTKYLSMITLTFFLKIELRLVHTLIVIEAAVLRRQYQTKKKDVRLHSLALSMFMRVSCTRMLAFSAP